MVWPCFNVFWFSKDNHTGHSERKEKKRQTEEEVGRQYQRMDRNGLAALLFWFFGNFSCGALLFMVIHVIYTYKK